MCVAGVVQVGVDKDVWSIRRKGNNCTVLVRHDQILYNFPVPKGALFSGRFSGRGLLFRHPKTLANALS